MAPTITHSGLYGMYHLSDFENLKSRQAYEVTRDERDSNGAALNNQAVCPELIVCVQTLAAIRVTCHENRRFGVISTPAYAARNRD